ncbi:MAG: IS1380 family transposase [Chitinophagales bacterium]|nr:IS1380 family transposase [Chitinophagales bacterium]
MYKTSNSNISSFGGIAMIHHLFSKHGVADFINNELGSRGIQAKYDYSDILLSSIYTTFCGGSATEDVNYIRENTLNHLKGIEIPSADTILRANKELSVDCDFLQTATGKENKVNINTRMNRFLLRGAIQFKQIDSSDKALVYDYDNQFTPAEKYDATYSYKGARGYFSGVATIGNVPFSIEGRNGNCNVKTEQLATHKRNIELLKAEGIHPQRARMDSGSYIKEVTDFFHQMGTHFFIRANQSENLLSAISKLENWNSCRIGIENYQTNSMGYNFGKHAHRIIAYRQPNSTGQTNAFTGDAYSYLFIITNDWAISERDAIIFYNKRGGSERVFDIQNNDFNWKYMPHSDLEYNTVYLIIMAFAYILYRFIINSFVGLVEGIDTSSRLKKFIFRVICIPLKIVRTGRSTYYKFATKNEKLIEMINSA